MHGRRDLARQFSSPYQKFFFIHFGVRVDHLNNLRALEAVLRKGGLRSAAEELGVTPAAVGQHIRNLENYLGLSLLTRHPTGSRPTPNAKRIEEALTRHMTGLRDVMDSLRPETDPNRISVSVLPDFAGIWFPRHLATLFSQIPGIDLRLVASRKLVDLSDGEFDFAIRYSREPSSEFAYERILDDYCAPICTPDFANRYEIDLQRASLKNVPLAEIDVASLGSSSGLPELVDWCREFSVVPPGPNSGQAMVDYPTAKRMSSSGLTIMLGGIHDFIEELEKGDVLLPFGPEKTILNEHKFWLIWRKDRRLSSTQRKFVQWIADHASKDRERVSQLLSP